MPGDYNLYAWVPGFIGDYRYNVTITIPKGRIFFPIFLRVQAKIIWLAQLNNYLFESLGGVITLDSLVYSPPRSGPTIWEIGFPDRTAAEFYVPDPYPTLMNKLYTEQRSDK